jgi:hypothetical protein
LTLQRGSTTLHSAGFPGKQQARYQDNFCLRKMCYDHVLVYDDFAKVTGTSTEDTAAGVSSSRKVFWQQQQWLA